MISITPELCIRRRTNRRSAHNRCYSVKLLMGGASYPMLVNLVEIDPLESIPKLQYLSLLDNNITKKPNYLLYVIYKLKSLRVLDFIKVKAKRAEAAALFSSMEAEEEVKKVSQEEVQKVSDTT